MRPPPKPAPISLYHPSRLAFPTLQCRRLVHQQCRVTPHIPVVPSGLRHNHPSRRCQSLFLPAYAHIRYASSSPNAARAVPTKLATRPARSSQPSTNASASDSAKKSPQLAQKQKSKSGIRNTLNNVAVKMPEPVQKAAEKVSEKIPTAEQTTDPLAHPTSIAPESPQKQNDKLNLPAETYAPPFDFVMPRLLDMDFKFAMATAKKVFVFFKDGGKRVWHNSQKAREYTKRVKEARKSDRALTSVDVLTRAEWQLVKRSRADLLRLIPFFPIAWVLGEWMIVFWRVFGRIVPEPCRVPYMVNQMIQRQEKWRTEQERRLLRDAPRLIRRDIKCGRVDQVKGKRSICATRQLERMGHYELMRWSLRLNAHSYVPWDYMSLVPPMRVLRWGIKRKLKYLEIDDWLILRNGGWKGLNEVELRRACMERGIMVLGRSEEELRRDLPVWKELAIFPTKILGGSIGRAR